MIETELIIAVLFRLINAAILFGLGYYIFRRYLSAGLHEKYNDYKKQLRSLKTETRTLEKDREHLIEATKRDALLCTQLKKRIAVWKRVVHTDQEEREARYAEYLDAMRARSAEQEKHLTIAVARKEVAPLVLAQLQAALAKKFADQKAQHTYLKKMAANLTIDNGRTDGSTS